MRFLIDANLPRSAVGLLVGFGHEVDFARDIGLASAPDEQIAIRAKKRPLFFSRVTWTSRTYDDIRQANTPESWCCGYRTTLWRRKLFA
jgi:Domain of unknown function (DUF5615)